MPNPTGKNQHAECPPPDDDVVADALKEYHRRGITDASIMAELLLKEHAIKISKRTIHRRRKTLGLQASGATTKALPETTKRQLVLDELADDPLSRLGPNLLRERILERTGIHLTRDSVRGEMKLHDPEGFEKRAPTARKIIRVTLTAIGPNHEWSADGHDKLSSIGFPIWGVRDKWSIKWLGLWVVPNNRRKKAVAYLYLRLVRDLGGMPVQSTTDCGSETTRMFALATALRDLFSDLDSEESPAHRFMRSINNITIERGWLRFRLALGDTLIAIWRSGSHLYNPMDEQHLLLHDWIWPKFIQDELNSFQNRMNSHVSCTDRNKAMPSGVAPAIAYALPERHGGVDCLIPVDRDVIQSLMDEIGEDVIRFVSLEYEEKAERVFLDIRK
ncbi:hypothetical protein BDN70DRAFT_888988 [Pholiota conissans]|uniref:Integrase core domain-containing protein n=1 Tax=Pholiota conissans TaxID=109636 RepID=A0A9P5YKN7_9AGAR|nr:hypothetical protein BDN70DRAFT_888988 [Pholiota conissans]